MPKNILYFQVDSIQGYFYHVFAMVENSLKKFVEETDNYTITFHQNPDGDAIGSALGLHQILRKMGKTGVVISPNSIGEYLSWLPGIDEVLVYDEEQEKCSEIILAAQSLFCLDFNDPSRAGGLEQVINDTKAVKVMIDHHLNPKAFAQHVLHDVDSPATAQLIFRLLMQLNGGKELLDESIATNLYTGMMTDTGSFRYPSTNKETHLAVAELMDTGFKHNEIHENIYDTFTVDRLHLFGHCFSNQHEIIEELETSILWVTLKDHETYHIEKGQTEGLVNYNLSVEGVKFGVLFVENEDIVKISFRSKGDFPANKFAQKYFQGGGHLNAAGGRSFVSLEKTIQRFKKKLIEFSSDLSS